MQAGVSVAFVAPGTIDRLSIPRICSLSTVCLYSEFADGITANSPTEEKNTTLYEADEMQTQAQWVS